MQKDQAMVHMTKRFWKPKKETLSMHISSEILGPVRLSIHLIHSDGNEPLVRLDTKSTTHPNESVE